MGLDPRELANGILVECESRSADLLRSVFRTQSDTVTYWQTATIAQDMA